MLFQTTMDTFASNLIFLVCMTSAACQMTAWQNNITDMIKKNLTQLKVQEKIKQQILEILNRTSPPKPIRNNTDLKTCKPYLDKNVTDSRAKVNQIISFSEPPDHFKNDRVIQFRFAQDVKGRRMIVKSASLHIRVKNKPRRNKKNVGKLKRNVASSPRKHSRKKHKRRRGKKVSLSVYTVKNDGHPGKSIAVVKSRIKKNKWFKVALDRAPMQELIDTCNGTVLLYVQCKGCRRNTQVVLVHSRRRRKRQLRRSSSRKQKTRKLNKGRPFLILHTFVETRTRAKRSEPAPVCLSDSDVCCKHSIYINFIDIGWDNWIISPRGFHTAECFGGCQRRQSNTTVCEATRRRSLRLIYQESPGVFINSFLPNFIVTRCGCRTSRDTTHHTL